jgi:hypothetical protein
MWSAYSIAYSIMNLWLWGSFFLVVLLFLRGFGSRWKRLNWLTCTRKRWLKIWFCFGLIRVIGLAILIAMITGFPDDGLDGIGWPAKIVSELPVPYIGYIDNPISGGIAEAIIRCCFSAFAWWIYNWWVEKFRELRTISKWVKLGMSLLAGAWLLGIANWLTFHKPYPPGELWMDLRGVPFVFFETDGGLFWIRKFVWSGVIWNALIMIGLSFCLATIWIWISRRKLDSEIPDISHGQG